MHYSDIFEIIWILYIDCPDGTQPVGSCVDNKCGYGFYCLNEICCKNLYLSTPKCLDGSEALSACINQKCGNNAICTSGDLCCPLFSSLCPTGLYYISECINSQCPSGYACFGSPPNAYCCGSRQPVTCSFIDFDGACTSDANCQAGFLCDVLNQRCCPNLGENPSAQGPCISGACAIGQYCLPSDQQCYTLYTTSVVPIVTTTTTTQSVTETVITTTVPVYTCDSTWTYFAGTQDCYKVFLNASWPVAESNCGNYGAHLASIHSAAENIFIADLAQTGYLDQNSGYNEAWIGLSNTIDVNTYQWSDGTPFDYDGWAPNRPGVIGKPRCVPISADHIQDYESDYQLWYDLSCSSSMRAYVCKKSSDVNSC